MMSPILNDKISCFKICSRPMTYPEADLSLWRLVFYFQNCLTVCY